VSVRFMGVNAFDLFCAYIHIITNSHWPSGG
jgi:hypothetical protein